MTETCVATPDPERDWEGEFYKTMATIPKPEFDALLMDVHKDMFDASNGPQVGRTADGNVGILVVCTDAVGKQLLDAWMAWHDHKCPMAQAALMGWLMHQMTLLEMFAPRFPQSVKEHDFFPPHEHEDDQ